MATPRNITIDTLNGNWILNKALSSEIDPVLKLQNVSWIFRKALALTDICLRISTSYSTGLEPTATIEFLQTPSMGKLASTIEKRTLDGETRHHSDYLFGAVLFRSVFVRGSSGTEDVSSLGPVFEVQTKSSGTDVERFLRGKTIPDESKVVPSSGGFLVEEPESDQAQSQSGGLWVHSFERSVELGWTAEQVWGFEMIHGHRYFTRRVAVSGAEVKYICGRFVYDFVK
ncbi:uncharacterized protein N7511_008308 [Penicillium nucicola]|uniref:uncharacterized protein n=1 Tax=Penicillium nucicola TaxID=1850975 RepID=UPI0025453AF6|nr:uncharacterized protein N7511_008308 [Penicillium nucicola]KAJ5754155.1 hypothetical protein N7511_008308 [Penicillium nucicola]